MRHSLYKYYTERRWAAAFLEGQILFRSPSYFRDYEDRNVRGDKAEGISIFRPENGLVINNLTRGTTFTLPGHTFQSAVKQQDIFVFCASKSHSDERRKEFKAAACVEVLDIKALCKRIETALPPGAAFRGGPVKYYHEADDCNSRWALPEKIATSKLAAYAWQDEYRLLFSLAGALEFENIELRLAPDASENVSRCAEHREYLVNAGSLHDICQFHEF